MAGSDDWAREAHRAYGTDKGHIVGLKMFCNYFSCHFSNGMNHLADASYCLRPSKSGNFQRTKRTSHGSHSETPEGASLTHVRGTIKPGRAADDRVNPRGRYRTVS